MEPRIVRVAIGPDQDVSASRNEGQVGSVVRDRPLGRVADVIGQEHPANIYRRRPGVVQLDPVVVLPLRIGQHRTIGGQEFVQTHLPSRLRR